MPAAQATTSTLLSPARRCLPSDGNTFVSKKKHPYISYVIALSTTPIPPLRKQKMKPLYSVSVNFVNHSSLMCQLSKWTRDFAIRDFEEWKWNPIEALSLHYSSTILFTHDSCAPCSTANPIVRWQPQ